MIFQIGLNADGWTQQEKKNITPNKRMIEMPIAYTGQMKHGSSVEEKQEHHKATAYP